MCVCVCVCAPNISATISILPCSRDSVLSFSGVCEKVASVWQYAAIGYAKLNKMKIENSKKVCNIF